MASDEALPANGQHKKPCDDCPFARTAINGWLGELTVREWVLIAHSDARIECHTLEGAQCAGAAIYRGNVGKLPRDKSVLVLPKDTQRVFSGPGDFEHHHNRSPVK
jgi:ribosomal protein S27E